MRRLVREVADFICSGACNSQFGVGSVVSEYL